MWNPSLSFPVPRRRPCWRAAATAGWCAGGTRGRAGWRPATASSSRATPTWSTPSGGRSWGRGQGTSWSCDRWIGKTGHEFFTGSSDGYIKWWDIRCHLQLGIVLVIAGVWCLVAGTSPRQSGSTAWSRASARTRTSRPASTASVSSPPSQASSWWGPSRAASSSAGQQGALIGGELVT